MMNCKPALEQLREPDALAVCGGATRQPRAPAKPLTLMDGDLSSCCCFERLLNAYILETLTKAAFNYNCTTFLVRPK